MKATFVPAERLYGEVVVPGDKSISHRAAIIASLAKGRSSIGNFSDSEDCATTLRVLLGLGTGIDRSGGRVVIEGHGGKGYTQPPGPLDCGNSGTTIRLVAGAVSPYPIDVNLTGDESLRRRPMRRIVEPLEMMGARLATADEEGFPPLTVRGGGLRGIDYTAPIPSAQVKSAVLLAGLGARGRTTVRELVKTRDHTERLLRMSGIRVKVDGPSVTVEPWVPEAVEFDVPADFSSAAFFVAAALMVPGSVVTIKGTGLNPTRTHFLRVVERMGARLETQGFDEDAPEPSGDLTASHGELTATEVGPQDVALAIDEVTLVAMLATSATGRTVISGAGELRHKESDRIRGTVEGLRAMGALIEETEDGMVVEGPVRLHGAELQAGGDHRLAMMFAVAGLSATGETSVDGWEWTRISYPGFTDTLDRICVRP